jgi:acyl-CoA thioesterase YciA
VSEKRPTEELYPLTSEGAVKATPSAQEPSIRVIMMPKDTNAHGTIFGGVILSYIDQAAAVEARRHGAARIVTVAMHEVVFHEPVNVGDLVSFYTRLLRVGRTSITVAVEVFSQRENGDDNRVKVTEAEVTFVNVDENRRPLPIATMTAAKK